MSTQTIANCIVIGSQICLVIGNIQQHFTIFIITKFDYVETVKIRSKKR